MEMIENWHPYVTLKTEVMASENSSVIKEINYILKYLSIQDLSKVTSTALTLEKCCS